MKIITIVGARPQFIKAAMGSLVIRKEHHEILIHTGQHFDANMSDVFFSEMGIPKPDYNLGISGGSHAEMTARMLIEIEKVLLSEKPDAVLVYGDTNSTLAAALAAVKIHIPVIHVESGNRFHTLESPEEVNRICTDHVSSLRFACTKSALDSLISEGLEENSSMVGDPMYDAYLHFIPQALERRFQLTDLNGNAIPVPSRYYFMTCHRQENTADSSTLCRILDAMQSLDFPTVYPVHPRNRNLAMEIMGSGKYGKVLFSEPVGYLESIALESRCEKIVTDSGGVQREAFFARKQCVTVLDFDVWPETMKNNANQLAKPDENDILSKLNRNVTWDDDYKPFGDGHSCEKMVSIIDRWRGEKK